jgi:hypothetical protein
MGICAMHMDHNEKNIENFGDNFLKKLWDQSKLEREFWNWKK